MTNFDSLEHHALCHKALAEPLRLRILALLQQRESLCVCDLVKVLAQSQSSVSRHLAYLKNQQLVNAWRESNWVHYALQESHPFNAIMHDSLQQLSHLAVVQADLARLQEYEKKPRQCDL
ncbi:transcriptional regulator [Thiosulfatimonas sediminis]|uniref:Transcriptional regulator n=1 Tax=Thiosulfatimonas sediminis TaxID=2675054 RepID=A0A6F8PT10_9GAMM|nr:metalloregulator ArsR/SmtB family transcription factor [Thiosulfatimonas sediminis]BBP45164.1 transcriptional regulator [Thiosulfatimonas sediminis]